MRSDPIGDAIVNLAGRLVWRYRHGTSIDDIKLVIKQLRAKITELENTLTEDKKNDDI